MAKKQKPPHEEDYLDIAEDIQQHKYLPGYFTGGRIDPLIRIAQRSSKSGAASRLGYIWLVSGAFTTGLALSNIRNVSASLIFFLVLGVVQLAAGIRVLIRCHASRWRA